MMESKARSFLHCVLFIVVILLPIYGLKGSALQPLTVSPPKFEVGPPNSQTEIPSVSPSTAPDASKEHKSPRIRKGKPTSGLYHPPASNSPFTVLPTPVSSPPRRFPLNPPNFQPSFTESAPSATHSAQNISFHSPAVSPALVTNPVNHGHSFGFPVAAPSKEMSNHRYPVNHFYARGFYPVRSPAPTEAKEASNTTEAPPVLPSHPLRSPPVMNPIRPEGKQSSNITDAPLSSHPGLSRSSPVMSPVPHDMKPPLNADAPLASHLQPSGSPAVINPTPHEVKEPSNFTDSPLPSNPLPLEPSPVTSPTPHEVKKPSNTTHSHLPSESSPAMTPVPHEVTDPSNNAYSPLPSHPKSSPVTSPTPRGMKDPLNTTHSPLPSDPLPLEPSPVTSPTPHEVKKPSNTTHSRLPSASPAITPVPHEVMNPSNNAYSPLPSHPKSSPVASPTPHGMKDPLNTTHSPLPSHPIPLESSPVISPAQHSTTVPSHNTHAPLASHPKPSELSPVVSPTPHVVKEPSNVTHSPFPSHLLPSESPPLISPSPHKVVDPSNVVHAPLASDPRPSRLSPMISPSSHDVNSSNITHSPLPSHLPPETSPVLAPPHEGTEPSNTTSAPLASHLKPSSPKISPTRHEFKEPSNATFSHLPSHPLPSQSSPVISPSTYEKEPSNITHSPLPSFSHPSEHPPAVSPVLHGAHNESNATHAPLASHRHHSVLSPLLSPIPDEPGNPSNISHAPVPSYPHPPSERIIQTPAVAPVISAPQPRARIRVENPAFAPFSPSQPLSHHPGPIIAPASSNIVSPSNKQKKHTPKPHIRGPFISPIQAPSHPPSVVPKSNQRNHAPSPYHQAPSLPPVRAPFPSASREITHAPSPLSSITSWHNKWPIHPPILPPGLSAKPRTPPPRPVWALPPPPPNLGCKPLSCKDPLTYPPPGSLCVCVWPIKVGLRLRISLYTFFPLVSELAQEIASGIFVKQSQVRIMGANAASEDPEKTIVLVDLVPLGRSFDRNTALLIFNRFWHKQVLITASYFGDYDVLYVLYPGLPPSPPLAPGESVDGGTLANGENARTMKPLGVDVKKRGKKLSGSLITMIVLLSVIVLVFSAGAAWLLLLKGRNCPRQPPPTSRRPSLPIAKPSAAGTASLTPGSGPSSTSASCTSSITAHGAAKTYSLAEVERATNRFHDSRIIGEGGFGRVYQGTLEDGTMIAVKVLKRDDHQGGREFLAEVEMLSRLHHRNLVKLIGICTEENVRCLIYELIPNGSVESHLHGFDKETSPLDWSARMKIALGAARGLAYLHEDSSPRVIHRDFKSSNILLEHDFTPKVSDFGLARTALDEGNDHISTRVMGTFGYVAPEYAMTGHLLVKSDVYSYGVVLLELLTGRKPVDMSQPPGQENLVSWARPLLTSMDGLEKLIDPALGTSISLDTVAKVAAIASMCVQPEVSHRPFMGEVVQALRLVCDESDGHIRSCSQDESTKGSDIIISVGSGLEEERILSESDIFCTSATFAKDVSGSFRRYSSSGPLKMGRSRKFWGGERGFSSGSMSDNGIGHKLGSSLDGREPWP